MFYFYGSENIPMKTITKIIEDYVYETTNENGNKISIDMRGNHEKNSLSPTELILAAVSACVAVDIVSILKKKKKEVVDFKIDTSAIRLEKHPRAFTQIHSRYVLTSPNTTETEFDKIAKLALYKYCSVASSLKAEIEYSVEVINPESN